MTSEFRFTCACCGEEHEGSPRFGYTEPHQYHQLTDDEKARLATLNTDFCRIQHPDQTDHFIRVCLEIPIRGVEHGFLWGVWISVSETNYNKYNTHFEDPAYEAEYFGYFCNRLPFYPDTLGLKTMARTRPGGNRPLISLEPTDHPLSVDSREGISWERAVEIAERALHPHL